MNLKHYRVHGLTVSSAIELPELISVAGNAAQADVVVSLGSVPTRLPKVSQEGPLWMAGGEQFLLTIPGVARYLTSGGHRIIVDIEPDVATGDVRVYLLGTVLGMLLHQRGLLALHAGAVEVNGQAIAIAGNSGAGKSTLVAHLRQRGYRLIGDDTLAVSFDEYGRPWAQPSFARIKLWADALKHISHSPERLERDLTRLEKFHLRVDDDQKDYSVPLGRVILLADNRIDDNIYLERLRGLDAVNALARVTYKPRHLKAIGLVGANFQHCSRAAKHADVIRLRRPKTLARMGDVLDRLEAAWNIER